jgi:hypothetical protein
MKKLILPAAFIILFTTLSFSQNPTSSINPSYSYVSNPGFVNITEINAAPGLMDTVSNKSKYYYGVTNIFGYQINRNFFTGAGIGYLIYEDGQLIPLFLEYRYNIYLRRFSPYLYADGGTLVDPIAFKSGSKIFINPGIGISRHISSKLEVNVSAGFMMQSRSTLTRVSFANFKLGIIFRKNSFRLYKPEKINSF